MSKICTKCDREKPADGFGKHKRGKLGLRSWCKDCESEHHRAYRLANPEKMQKRVRDWQKNNPEKRRANQKRVTQNRKALILKAKDKPCVDCGTKLPAPCMHFDHVRGVKEFDLGVGRAYSTKRIKAEIEKCEVRCPNCHSLRHYHERVAA